VACGRLEAAVSAGAFGPGPVPGAWSAALVAAGLAAAVVVLFRAVRGVVVDPARPPSRSGRLLRWVRSPALAARLGAAIVVAVVTLLVTRWPVAAAGLGGLVLTWPLLFGGARTEQAQIDRVEALVQWTEALRDTIAAHASLEQAIPATTEHAPALIRPALIRLAGQLQARTPMDTALLNLAADLDDPTADAVIAALVLNVRRRGDLLREVLTSCATTMREDLELRRRICADRAGLRRGVQIVVVVTIALAGMLVAFSRDFLAPYNTPAGQIALLVVLGLFASGFIWLRRLAISPPLQPFLARPGRHLSLNDRGVIAALAAQPTSAQGWTPGTTNGNPHLHAGPTGQQRQGKPG
jgi:tight adherence protein B